MAHRKADESLFVQTKPGSFFKSALLPSKIRTTFEPSIDE
jgi:hypothetical protein